MKKTEMRTAIAMIELIFAIVVMAIVLMSAPMLISTATKSGYVALQQESIAAASSEIGMILTRHWDERNTDQNLSGPILRAAGNSDLNESTNAAGDPTGRRAGTPASSERSFLTSVGGAGGGRLDATPSASLGDDSGDRDDLDDFDGNTTRLQQYLLENTTTAVGDYIDQNISIQTTVSYIDDNPDIGSSSYAGSASTLTLNDPFNRGSGTGDTSNIKLVTVTLTTNNTAVELNKTIVLQAFSCNIGTYNLNTKDF